MGGAEGAEEDAGAGVPVWGVGIGGTVVSDDAGLDGGRRVGGTLGFTSSTGTLRSTDGNPEPAGRDGADEEPLVCFCTSCTT